MFPDQKVLIDNVLVALDLLGTFVFALSGAADGVKHRLDLFGVLVVAFAAATAGGIGRDVMLGAVPPAAISDWRYLAVPLLAGLLAFYWNPIGARLHSQVLVFDAAGLALFAVSGAMKALAFGASAPAAMVLGVLTGIGGGMVRDLLVREVPVVLHSELYAVAALAGASIVVVGRSLELPLGTGAVTGAVVCFGLRIVAIRRGWRLPRAGEPPRTST
jgi:uncharacterized membrane protein YeiH